MNAPSRYKALQPNTRFSGRVERQRGEGEQSRANEAVGSAEDHGPHRSSGAGSLTNGITCHSRRVRVGEGR